MVGIILCVRLTGTSLSDPDYTHDIGHTAYSWMVGINVYELLSLSDPDNTSHTAYSWMVGTNVYDLFSLSDPDYTGHSAYSWTAGII